MFCDHCAPSPLLIFYLNLLLHEFFADLTPEEQNVLINIRKRKLELLQEINQLREELTEVNTEIEAMDTEEG